MQYVSPALLFIALNMVQYFEISE